MSVKRVTHRQDGTAGVRSLRRSIARAQEVDRPRRPIKPRLYGARQETTSQRKRRKAVEARERARGPIVTPAQEKSLVVGGLAMGKRARNLQRGLWRRGRVNR